MKNSIACAIFGHTRVARSNFCTQCGKWTGAKDFYEGYSKLLRDAAEDERLLIEADENQKRKALVSGAVDDAWEKNR